MSLPSKASPRAIILAGGKGTRLQPFTAHFPKPLVPLGDTPVIEVLIRWLIQNGITDVTLTLGHLAELIRAYFDHRKQLADQITLRFVQEEEPTGTAGSISLVKDLTDTFLVLNGDLLTNLDLQALIQFHKEQNAILTVAAHRRDVKVDLGVLEFDSNMRITDYKEKPETTYHVSMGIYVYEPTVLAYIQSGTYLDFPNLVLRLLENGEKVCAYPADCLWLDIGRPSDYALAQELFENQRKNFEHV